MTKGTYKYVPKEVVEYIEECKSKMGLRDSEAFKKMVEDSRIGKQVKLTLSFDLGRRK